MMPILSSKISKKKFSRRKSIHLLLLFRDSQGEISGIERALKDAAVRGVDVKLMVDGVGSATFRKSQQRRELMQAGVEVRTSLRVNIVRMWFQRVDLRIIAKLLLSTKKLPTPVVKIW